MKRNIALKRDNDFKTRVKTRVLLDLLIKTKNFLIS